MTAQSNLRGIMFMLLAGAAFVANDSLIKLTLDELPPMQVLVLRGLSGFLWCLPILLLFGYGAHIRQAFSFWVLMRSLFELVAIMAFIRGLTHMAIGDVTAIYQISPLLVLVGAALIWREKIGPWQILLISLGLIGALMVAQPGGSTATSYAIFPFVTAFGAAARDLVSRKVPTSVPGLVVGFSTIVVVLVAAAIEHAATESWIAPSVNSLWAMLGAGLFLMLGHTFVFLSYRHGAVSAVAPFGYSFTGWALLSGYLVFAEVPNALAITGMLLIVASGLAAIAHERRSSQKVSEIKA